MSHKMHKLAIEPEYRAHARTTQTNRTGNDCVEYALNVSRRPTDYGQNLARRRSLL
jgi:hypothetical protein